MEFYFKKFRGREITIYPLGDWHFGSRQTNLGFINQVISEVKETKNGYWVGVGDLMENAIIGSKSDMYTQLLPPKEQMEHIADLLEPIKDKGLFMIGGNHEARTMRQSGIQPEMYIATRLGIPYMGFSCMAVFELDRVRGPYRFMTYYHHNTGGGYSMGGKINAAEKLRLITPSADATFSAHLHTTGRIPIKWYEAGDRQIIERLGYDYLIGSALTWNGSYAEEKAKRSAAEEHIAVTFSVYDGKGSDNRRQHYRVIIPEMGGGKK
jgi:hypothetical protein